MIAKGIKGKPLLRYIDVGASAIKKPRVAVAFPSLNVVAFDPDPRSKSDFVNLGFNVEYFSYGVAGTNELRTFYLTQKSHCSSLLKPLKTEDSRYHVSREILIDCRTLDSLEVEGDVLKIDVQGAELEILREAKLVLSNAYVVELEVWFNRRYQDQARIDEIHDILAQYGFKLAGISALYYDDPSRESGIGFGDMVYVNSRGLTHGLKVILVSLVDASLDRLIPRFVAKYLSGVDLWLIYFIRLLGIFKFKAPKIY